MSRFIARLGVSRECLDRIRDGGAVASSTGLSERVFKWRSVKTLKRCSTECLLSTASNCVMTPSFLCTKVGALIGDTVELRHGHKINLICVFQTLKVPTNAYLHLILILIKFLNLWDLYPRNLVNVLFQVFVRGGGVGGFGS